jgi:sigma-54 dependent transcriptional regulator, acetoin dehydrogenase operon transcriptional activator AcoR
MSDTLSAIVSTQRKPKGKPALFVGLAGDAPRSPPARISLAGLDRVDLGRGSAEGNARRVDRRKADGADIVTITLPDPRMSTQHARITRIGGSWVVEDTGSKNGTWLGTNRVARQPLADGDPLIVGHTAIVYRDTGGEDADLDGEPAEIVPGLRTLSPALADRYRELAAAAKSPVPIQITGETGTGKELVARAAHELSGRAGRFVAVNCGALTESLLEGELFGHKKGAYTGATDERAGFIRSAHGGTLFLDEVAELPTASQAALLRVLQEGEVVPVGGDHPVKVDIRLVTATHRDLDNEVAASRFRADLRARMLGVAVVLPPLRHRREDLGLLVKVLLDRLAPGRAVTFSADAVSALYTHDWPLNVRELERSLAAALAVAKERIELQHLPAAVGSTEPMEAPAFRSMSPEERALREQLVAAIAKHEGNLAGVAREMGKDRTQIRRWMKRFGITRDVS